MKKNSIPIIDTWAVEEHLSEFLHSQLRRAGRNKVVVGLSGGIDSSTAAALAARSLGSEHVIGLILPYGERRPEDVTDALELAELFHIHTRQIDIAPMVDAYFSSFPHAAARRRGNKMARERMSILYDWAEYHEALVMGTGNRTELYLGYLTKYGDGGVDLEPLGGLYKCEVRQLAASMGLPPKLINRVPTAGLWQGQTDEGELGMSYDVIDSILYHMLDLRMGKRSLLKAGFAPADVEMVGQMTRASRHKRLTPPFPALKSAWRKRAD